MLIIRSGSKVILSGLRAEWAKARARALRWKEEVVLLEEEMRRSIQFCRTMVSRWKTRKEQQRSQVPLHVAEGMKAYAIEQMETEELRGNTWAAAWMDIRARAQVVLKKSLREEGEEDISDLPDIVVPDVDPLDIDA
jgi:hypothetical protein